MHALSRRAALFGIVLTTVVAGVAGAQPVVASSPDPRDPAGSSATGYQASGSDPSGDWHRYHHWTDPTWPDPDQLAGTPTPEPTPRPERSGYGWTSPRPPLTLPPSSDWFPPTESYPTLTSTPTMATTSTPVRPPSTEDEPGQEPDRVNRDPVAAAPDDQAPSQQLDLGDPVEQPSPSPRPTVTATNSTPDAPTGSVAPIAARPVRADTAPTSGAQHTLVYSGMLGLALALIGLTMVGLRRRKW
jgi:hypothetical protein